jgi:hypothetical protein
MSPKENESFTFHNEAVLLNIARWAKVVGWTIPVIYLLSFINSLTETINNIAQLPPDLMSKLLVIANVLFPLLMAGFYFLLMHGLAQVLYVALDLFITTEEDEPAEGIAA